LDKIILNYIDLHINFGSDTKSFISLNEYLRDTEWLPEQLFVIVNNNNVNLPEALKQCKRVSADIEININSTATHLAKQIRNAEQLLHDNSIAKNIIFNIQLSKSFYHNIAGIQALKIIWQNILDAYDLDTAAAFHILAHINDTEGLDENTHKINTTIQALSAVVSGIQFLIIHPQESAKDQGFERRINRNVQHLLKLESYMDQVMNPIEGSYYFDHLTKSLAGQTWSEFQLMD